MKVDPPLTEFLWVRCLGVKVEWTFFVHFDLGPLYPLNHANSFNITSLECATEIKLKTQVILLFYSLKKRTYILSRKKWSRVMYIIIDTNKIIFLVIFCFDTTYNYYFQNIALYWPLYLVYSKQISNWKIKFTIRAFKLSALRKLFSL